MPEGHTPLSWGHINVNVSDLDASIDFYQKLGFDIFLPAIPYLGLSLEPTPQPLPEHAITALNLPQGTLGRACIVGLGDGFPKLDLTEFSGEAAPPLSNQDLGAVRLCLISEDLSAEVARLKNVGVEFLADIQTDSNRLADVALYKDPDVTLIELLQVYLERWQPFLAGQGPE